MKSAGRRKSREEREEGEMSFSKGLGVGQTGAARGGIFHSIPPGGVASAPPTTR